MDWEPTDVVAKECRVPQAICQSIQRLLNENCTIPFVCRYRAHQIGNATPETVRAVARCFTELEDVSAKALAALKTNARAQTRYAKLQATGRSETPEAIALRATLFTPSVEAWIRKCTSLAQLRQLIAPFRPPPRPTKAMRAREAGVTPLVDLLLAGKGRDLSRRDLHAIAPSLATWDREQLLLQARAVLADVFAKDATTYEIADALKPPIIRSQRRSGGNDIATLETRSVDAFAMYFEFRCPVVHLKPHHVLAMNRGEEQKVLSITVEFAPDAVSFMEAQLRRGAFGALVPAHQGNGDLFSHKDLAQLLSDAVRDAWVQFLQLARRIRSELTRRARLHAVDIFAANLKSLLLTPGISMSRSSTLLSLDPGFKHGCKYAVLSSTGDPLTTGVLFLHPRQEKEVQKLRDLLKTFAVSVIAIGDGTASRETELLVSDVLQARDISPRKRRHAQMTDSRESFTSSPIQFVSVNESGVSIWSVSPEAEADLPGFRPEIRSAIAIGRRLIDPLCEYTKIDPKNLGVGLYQHDIPKKDLKQALGAVTESCVSLVGLDLNIAPAHLMANVAALGPSRAAAIVAYRVEHGGFTSRLQLLEVKGIGPKVFEQCAGFLRLRYRKTPLQTPDSSDVEMISVGEDRSPQSSGKKRKRRKVTASCPNRSFQGEAVNPLDSTWIHPEHYDAANWIIEAAGASLQQFGTSTFQETIRSWFSHRTPLEIENVLERLQIDGNILKLIVDGLTSNDGFLDIRDRMCAPLLRRQALTLDDLVPEQELKGRVTNITSFGAFVDIGIGRHGLIHSTVSDLGALFVGQIVNVVIVSVDRPRERIRLRLARE